MQLPCSSFGNRSQIGHTPQVPQVRKSRNRSWNFGITRRMLRRELACCACSGVGVGGGGTATAAADIGKVEALTSRREVGERSSSWAWDVVDVDSWLKLEFILRTESSDVDVSWLELVFILRTASSDGCVDVERGVAVDTEGEREFERRLQQLKEPVCNTGSADLLRSGCFHAAAHSWGSSKSTKVFFTRKTML